MQLLSSLEVTIKMLSSRIASTSRRALSKNFILRPCTRISQRNYASSSPEQQREKLKDKAAVGPFNVRAAGLFVATGIGLFLYFRSEKLAVEERKRQETAQQKVGRPKIGGDFNLVMPVHSQTKKGAIEGRQVTQDDLKGSFSLIYFGFTNCPDICPLILDQMGEVLQQVDAKHGPVIDPVFITCDPARDSLENTSIYIDEFHPRFIGLTGSYEAVKQACKAYRVYWSTPPDADPSGDYLVDHSIFMFLMDPHGQFVEAFGKSASVEEISTKTMGFIEKWKEAGFPIESAETRQRLIKDQSRTTTSQ